MVPWPLARFGAAAQLLGRPPGEWLPITAGLGPELLTRTRVVLGSDLESIGLATGVATDDPAVVARIGGLLEQLTGVAGRAFFDGSIKARSSTRAGLTIMMRPGGPRCSLEHPIGFDEAVRGAPDVASRIGPLAQQVDHIVDHLAAASRIGAHTTDRAAVAALLERSAIARAQQSYFADTAPVWTKWNPTMAVRIPTDATGVEVAFRSVPAEHLVRIWRTFQPREDLAQRIGAFVGAMGVEVAECLELHMSASGEPTLEATFVPAATPFGHQTN